MFTPLCLTDSCSYLSLQKCFDVKTVLKIEKIFNTCKGVFFYFGNATFTQVNKTMFPVYYGVVSEVGEGWKVLSNVSGVF